MTSRYASRPAIQKPILGFQSGLHYSRELERVVLGVCMYNRSAPKAMVSLLTALDFYDTYHREVFTAIDTMYRANLPIDLLSLADHFTRHRRQPLINGEAVAPYLARISGAVTHDTHFNYWCHVLKELTNNRNRKAANPVASGVATKKPRHFPFRFARFLIKTIDRELITQTASKYPATTIRGGPYVIRVDTPELVYLMSLLSPGHTWTTAANADEQYTRAQCTAAIPKGAVLKQLKDGTRYWEGRTTNYPLNWDNND